MEIVNGRECEIYEVGNGDKIYFIEKLKGREYRLLKHRLAGANVASVSGTESTPNMSLNFQTYTDVIFGALDIFAIDGIDDKGKHFKPDLDYFDRLEMEYADKLYNKLGSLTGTVNKVEAGKKK